MLGHGSPDHMAAWPWSGVHAVHTSMRPPSGLSPPLACLSFLVKFIHKNILSFSCKLYFKYQLYRYVLCNETNKTRSHLHTFEDFFYIGNNSYAILLRKLQRYTCISCYPKIYSILVATFVLHTMHVSWYLHTDNLYIL